MNSPLSFSVSTPFLYLSPSQPQFCWSCLRSCCVYYHLNNFVRHVLTCENSSLPTWLPSICYCCYSRYSVDLHFERLLFTDFFRNVIFFVHETASTPYSLMYRCLYKNRLVCKKSLLRKLRRDLSKHRVAIKKSVFLLFNFLIRTLSCFVITFLNTGITFLADLCSSWRLVG